MAQISDVMHASAVFDAARQELAWAYSSDFIDVPKPMKGAVHAISAVLNDAEMRWVRSTREEPMAAVVDKENAMAVVATGHEKLKREDVGVVKELDTRSVGDAERKIKDWLQRLEEVACDMRAVARKELLLGDYSKIGNKLRARWLPCLPRSTSRAARIAPTLDTVARDLEELKKQYDSTGLPLVATCTEQQACSNAAGGQDVLVERDDDVKQGIIDIINYGINNGYLYGGGQRLLIVGPPCVGKTTLVKSVFHEGSFGACHKVWVDMRKGWGIEEIHKSIVKVVGRYLSARSYYYKGMTIAEMLRRSHDKKLLLVLDNLEFDYNKDRDRSMWYELSEFLTAASIDDRVITILIMRSEILAKFVSFWDDDLYRLHPCSDGMCWEIIKRTATGTYLSRDRGSNLEAAAVALEDKVGREIASKCSGIPLVAKALGRFLQSVDPQEWPGLSGDIWNIRGGFSSDSSQQLRRLPIHSATVFTHLKRSRGVQGAESWLSLAYCAFVFPKGKGHGVVTCDLLNQWCSLGITTRERGASCISELLDRSLLLGEKPASYYGEDETEAAKLLRIMEDLKVLRMEDLMHDFARYHLGDRLIIVDGTNGNMLNVNNDKSSGACLALVSNFDAKQQLDITSILPAAGILALRFEDCREMELSKVDFASAKYACLCLLDLSGCSVKKLPHSIVHLKRLRYLRAPGIQDQKFPRPITGLYELRYLILRGSCKLSDLTEAFERPSNLLHVDLSGCTELKKLPKSFGRLWMLERLDLSGCSGIEVLPESFGWLRNLSHLDMSGCSGLEALPKSFGGLNRLWHLDMSSCSGLKALPESFGGLNRLWHLDLSRCSGLQDLPTSFQSLTELRHLDLSGLSRLRALPMVELPKELRHLNLSGCSGLQELEHLNLSGCSRLEEEQRLPHAPEPNELRHLDLSGCSQLWSLPHTYSKLEKLVHLNLSGCSSLSYLPDVWTRHLEHLDLSYCSQLTHFCMEREYLPQQLQYLDLSGCLGLSEKYPFVFSRIVHIIRSKGGRVSGLGTSGTTS